jgi:hypothetical protein
MKTAIYMPDDIFSTAEKIARRLRIPFMHKRIRGLIMDGGNCKKENYKERNGNSPGQYLVGSDGIR